MAHVITCGSSVTVSVNVTPFFGTHRHNMQPRYGLDLYSRYWVVSYDDQTRSHEMLCFLKTSPGFPHTTPLMFKQC